MTEFARKPRAPASKVKSKTVQPFTIRRALRSRYRFIFLMADAGILRSIGAVNSPQITILGCLETKSTSGRRGVGTSLMGQTNVSSRST